MISENGWVSKKENDTAKWGGRGELKNHPKNKKLFTWVGVVKYLTIWKNEYNLN